MLLGHELLYLTHSASCRDRTMIVVSNIKPVAFTPVVENNDAIERGSDARRLSHDHDRIVLSYFVTC
jgi:hypothetical protein